MIVVQGTPVNDSLNTGRILTGPATVSVLHNITYKYMSIASNKDTTLAENTIQSISNAQDTRDTDILQNQTVT
jgi:hypothetical protein